MTTDRNHPEPPGEAVRDAYRPFALTEAQRRRHRERLAAVARRPEAGRLRSRIAEPAAIAAAVLIVAVGFLVWNSLDPGSDDEVAMADATQADTDCIPLTSDVLLDPLLPAAVTQPLRQDTIMIYCTPTLDPVPTLTTPTAEMAPPVESSSTPTVAHTVAPQVTPPGSDQYGFIDGQCVVTPYVDSLPPRPGSSGVARWFGGDPRGLWVGLGREMEGVWATETPVGWWLPEPRPIGIEGRRLDGDAPPLEADLQPDYAAASLREEEAPSDRDSLWHPQAPYQFGTLHFPEPGCWEVVARTGGVADLRFVVEVVPFDESPPVIRARQRFEFVIAERDGTIPFPVPESCAVGDWIGPDDRLGGRYLDAVAGRDDWTYSYFLDGEGISLNSRLGLLFAGSNTVFWLSASGPLPDDATFTARSLDGEPAGAEFALLDFPTYAVPTGNGGSLTVHAAAITFPAAGCWELRVDAGAASFSQTVYVYPRPEDLAATSSEHERLYIVDATGRIRGIDLANGARFLTLEAGSYSDLALSPDGLTLYASGYADGGGSLAAYDAITGEEQWKVSTDYGKAGYLGDGGPPAIAVSADGTLAYVYRYGDTLPDSVSRHRALTAHDTSNGQIIFESDPVQTSCAASIWTSISESRVLALCKGGGHYHLFDMASGELLEAIGTVPVGGLIVDIAGAVDGTLVYVVTDRGNLAIYARESLEVVESVELISDERPAWSGLALSPDGSRLYVGVSSTETGAYFDEVRVFDTASWEEVDRFALGFDAFGRALRVDSGGNLYGIEWLSQRDTRVWKRDAATGEVTILLAANTEVRQLLLASGP